MARAIMTRARRATFGLIAAAGLYLGLPGAALADPLLEEIVSFTGDVLFLEYKVPGLVIGAVRDGEVAIHGPQTRPTPNS